VYVPRPVRPEWQHPPSASPVAASQRPNVGAKARICPWETGVRPARFAHGWQRKKASFTKDCAGKCLKSSKKLDLRQINKGLEKHAFFVALQQITLDLTSINPILQFMLRRNKNKTQ
jgi:hypothetical protein